MFIIVIVNDVMAYLIRLVKKGTFVKSVGNQTGDNKMVSELILMALLLFVFIYVGIKLFINEERRIKSDKGLEHDKEK